MTDVTGFGLAGHASEMAEGAGLTFEIDVASLPVIAGVEPLAIPRYFTRASKSNRAFLDGRLRIEPTADPSRLEFAFDAQTSGGLLIAVDPRHLGRLLEELQSRRRGLLGGRRPRHRPPGRCRRRPALRDVPDAGRSVTSSGHDRPRPTRSAS